MLTWIAARLRSFGFAFAGLAWMVRTQGNAQIHALATVIVAIAGLALRVSGNDWLWLIAAMAMVWISEALNTALEQLCDVVSPGRREAIRRAKDVAAGAVLVAAMAAAAIGLTVLWPYVRATLS